MTGAASVARELKRVIECSPCFNSNWGKTDGVGFSPSRVTAVFEGSLLSFMLPGGTNFEDLADRLDYIGDRIGGRVVALKVKFGSSPEIWPNTG
jgi:hypothetical protein